MDDPFIPSKPGFDLGIYEMKRMVLSPAHWATYNSPLELKWTMTRFDKANAANVPKDDQGVYSFLIQPGIAQHTACSYLMYVGKTEKQGLRKRFQQYFEHIPETSRRAHISKLIRQWQDHLWFCYAPITDHNLIDGAEQALLNSYLPPYNHSYRGVVAKQLKHLFT
jgi:hypothetical protein